MPLAIRRTLHGASYVVVSRRANWCCRVPSEMLGRSDFAGLDDVQAYANIHCEVVTSYHPRNISSVLV